MDIKKLQSLVIDALEDVKAQDIKIYDTSHLTGLFDRIAIASGTSNRQTKALASSVRDKVKENGGTILSIEGENTGEWVLVDMGDMIVHIMQPPIRAYYRLEEIWGDKEITFDVAKRGSKQITSRPMGDDTPKKISRHLIASQALKDEPETPKTPSRKKTIKPEGATTAIGKTIKVAATKSSVARKTAIAKKTPTKTVTKRIPAKTKVSE